MLANSANSSAIVGTLKGDIHKPQTFLHELVGFISGELPKWRGRVERKAATAETVLTSQLCAHLNSASRHAGGWDSLQFRVEEPDENQPGRRMDMVAAPTGTAIIVGGRRYVDFDTLLPVECKRLPTPKDKARDEREYVFCKHSSRGGIQRFKAGNHGSNHRLGAMIGYLQADGSTDWNTRINSWIDELADVEAGWTAADRLAIGSLDASGGSATLASVHSRIGTLGDIELRHLWIEMR
ncbi:hypothetical protein [Rhodoplanes sp. Z2-YC6860]|uniref:hypothetical protein n=1 Tax=Rhodoplanes sp. Z2-YC6860 TaxID=674703 RepID=UPI00078BDF46|nr:hypothetical protein [Rhodoplanes sp. Z2-YC6860]AMN39040.1 hypothetical protein RHPLAN_05750 [Rhodoplanes sp. Z2-YC6860]